jgi:HAD superfamily hydrolase (TIGR01490 family)
MALAIFDLDDTLIAGDSASLWLRYLVDQGLADTAMLEREAEMMRDYRAGHLQMEDYMTFTLQPLRGQLTQRVAFWAEHFIQTRILPIVFAAGHAALGQYRRDGWRQLIISATGNHLVGPIAQVLGVEDYLAIGLETLDGRYTGQTQGTLTYREGKVTRLTEWAAQQGEDLAHSHGYSDSVNDVPLLSVVAHAHVVNPDAQLEAIAAARGWTRLAWNETVGA